MLCDWSVRLYHNYYIVASRLFLLSHSLSLGRCFEMLLEEIRFPFLYYYYYCCFCFVTYCNNTYVHHVAYTWTCVMSAFVIIVLTNFQAANSAHQSCQNRACTFLMQSQKSHPGIIFSCFYFILFYSCASRLQESLEILAIHQEFVLEPSCCLLFANPTFGLTPKQTSHCYVVRIGVLGRPFCLNIWTYSGAQAWWRQAEHDFWFISI